MSKKREFPSDWSNMPDDEVWENIAYLLANYKRYSVSEPDDYITIIGNVKVQTVTREISDSNGSRCECFYDVNGKSVARETAIGRNISTLRHRVFLFNRSFKRKLNEFWQDYSETIGWGLVGLALTSSLIFAHVIKNKKQEQFKQEIIKEALEQFRQEQQKDTILYQPQKMK